MMMTMMILVIIVMLMTMMIMMAMVMVIRSGAVMTMQSILAKVREKRCEDYYEHVYKYGQIYSYRQTDKEIERGGGDGNIEEWMDGGREEGKKREVRAWQGKERRGG